MILDTHQVKISTELEFELTERKTPLNVQVLYIVWSLIPHEIKKADTFSIFKKKLKAHLLENHDYSSAIT